MENTLRELNRITC